jgi:hypothetical protein
MVRTAGSAYGGEQSLMERNLGGISCIRPRELKICEELLFEGPTRKSGKVNGRTVSVLPAAGADNSKNGRQATPENRGYRREPEKKCE